MVNDFTANSIRFPFYIGLPVLSNTLSHMRRKRSGR